MENRRLVKISVQLVDALSGEVLGTATERTDLLTGGGFDPLNDHRQDLFADLVGGLGTEAYRAAFGREVEERA